MLEHQTHCSLAQLQRIPLALSHRPILSLDRASKISGAVHRAAAPTKRLQPGQVAPIRQVVRALDADSIGVLVRAVGANASGLGARRLGSTGWCWGCWR